MNAIPEITWFFCSLCHRETKHKKLLEECRSRTYGDDQFSMTVVTEWQILQCNGCEELTMCRWDGNSEDGPEGRTTFFPPQPSRREPAWLSEGPIHASYRYMLKEVYAAFNADNLCLAMMGTRALIDMVMTNALGEQPSFKVGLQGLLKSERISKLEHTIITTAVNAGSAAAHRGYRPEKDDLASVIDVVERMIESEILEVGISDLAERIPPRQKIAQRQKGSDINAELEKTQSLKQQT